MNEAAQAASPPWIVAVAIDMSVTLPDGGIMGRDEFHAWLWERAEGLLGIDEGTVTATEAAASGLVPAWMVIDTAAAPPDRDWVGDLAIAHAEWYFADEWSARSAAGLVADLAGCRIQGISVDDPVDHEQPAPFGPVVIPGFGTVRAASDRGEAGIDGNGEATIFIEPGLGFGTGLHETTQLCLAALADRWRCNGRFDRVLDHGSGSGILGIAAVVLGAARVDAVEIDTNVHAALRDNARRNGVDGRLHLARDLPVATEPFDVVVANIVAAVLLEQAAELCGHVSRRGGELVLSGLLADETPAVAERFATLLGIRPRITERGVWGCLSFRCA
ncbi:MAG: 50S ribosomal protein L11 methyltransferase [Planctomycetia bacterium]